MSKCNTEDHNEEVPDPAKPSLSSGGTIKVIILEVKSRSMLYPRLDDRVSTDDPR